MVEPLTDRGLNDLTTVAAGAASCLVAAWAGAAISRPAARAEARRGRRERIIPAAIGGPVRVLKRLGVRVRHAFMPGSERDRGLDDQPMPAPVAHARTSSRHPSAAGV